MPEVRARALSIRQPWAWAVIHAGKDIENRSPAAVRTMANAVGQRVFVHAAKHFNRGEFDECLDFLRNLKIDPPPADAFAFGGVIGSVRIDAVVTSSRSRWFLGPRGLRLAEPRPLPFFVVKGQLNLFYVTPPPGITP